MKLQNKHFAFTLAEVLITLGIIGIVAAMTIPTLILNGNAAKYSSQFKKSISSLSQAARLSQAKYDIDYAAAVEPCYETDSSEEVLPNYRSVCAVLKTTLVGANVSSVNPYLNTAQISPDTVTGGIPISVDRWAFLADGSIFGFSSDAVACTKMGTVMKEDINEGGVLEHCVGYIDVNGITTPNIQVSCKNDDGISDTGAISPCSGVPNHPNYLTDVFPVVIHDAMVEPASPAAAYVLKKAKR